MPLHNDAEARKPKRRTGGWCHTKGLGAANLPLGNWSRACAACVCVRVCVCLHSNFPSGTSQGKS